MKKLGALLGIIMVSMYANIALAASLQAPDKLAIGQPAIVQVKNAPAGLQLLFQERAFPVYALPGGGYGAMIAADLKTSPGNYELSLMQEGAVLAKALVQVVDKDYGTRNITVEQKYVEPDEATMERINRENSQQAEVFNAFTPQRYWHGPFILPLDSAIVGKFGRKSIINGQPRSPHGGVDFRGSTGTPIKAPAAGRVALVLDSYFSGNLVLLDHGQGLISAYRHLSKVLVNEGQMLKQGQTLGLVGATGRVTGPHLHFDMHLSGATVDPLALINMSKTMSKMLQEK